LIFHSAITGTRRTYTYAELLEKVAQLGGALRELGVQPGDRVVIYLPMVPEAAIAMLACARIGAVHSVVFGGFAAAELAARIEDAQPKVIISASCGLEAGKVSPTSRYSMRPGPDHSPAGTLRGFPASPAAGRPRGGPGHRPGPADASRLVPARDLRRGGRDRPAVHPLHLGTTGKPKGIVRDQGGHAVALAYSMRAIYDIGPGDVMFTASDVGWVVGHSYIVYAPLLVGATTVLYEGKPVGTPDAGAFWRVVAEHRVKAMFTAPTAIRAIRKADPDGELLAGVTPPRCKRCSWPASDWTPTPTPGPRSGWACRWSTTGGRPRPAGRLWRTRAAWRRCRSRPARPRFRCRLRRTGARCARRGAAR
jgi:propionyl-CoA synthetase